MTDFTDLAERYLSIWNEPGTTAGHQLINLLFSDDAGYVDPVIEVVGREQIEAVVVAVGDRFPGFTFRLVGTVDRQHHRQVRFSWELGPVGEEAPVGGFDVATLDADGRIASVLGFLDRVPGGEDPPSQELPAPSVPVLARSSKATGEAEPDGTAPLRLPDLAATTASYAVGLLVNVTAGPEVVQYLQRIDETVSPFDGRFLIHGEPPDDVENRLPGDLIVIAFPDPDGATRCYHSDGYQAIAALRQRNSSASITLHPGVPSTHRATDILR